MTRTSPRKKQMQEPNTNGKVSEKSTTSKASEQPSLKRKAKGDSDPSTITNGKKPKITKVKSQSKSEDTSMPLAERTAVTSLKRQMYIGAHVSAAGGVQNSVTNALHIGANAFALFLKSQRKWDNPPLAPEAKELFLDHCKSHKYKAAEHAVPHGSYLVNLAQADETKAAQAFKGFLDDLSRCEQLGIRLYNFHPGSTGGDKREDAIGRIASQLNKAHKQTKSVVTLLENMAGGGNVIGSTWEDLRDIIALVDDKTRVGVCIDTCHAFAAGHDLRTPEAFRDTVDAFDRIVGLKYLRAFHLNDSKAPFKSKRDLHANIGTGFLGLRAFHSIMNEGRFCNMPMVLETPIDKEGPNGKTIEDKQVWADEIKMLESLIGLDPESKEFTELEGSLQTKGAAERRRIEEQVQKKAQKGTKANKGKGAVK